MLTGNGSYYRSTAFTAALGPKIKHKREHSPTVRRLAAERLEFLGVAINADINEFTSDDGDIGACGATVRTVVITAREDRQIAREVRQLLSG